MKIFMLLVYLSASYFNLNIQSDKLKPTDGFPVWLKDGKIHTDQTSGITFLKKVNNYDYFLTADDIGKIHRLGIKNNEVKLSTIAFNNVVSKFLEEFKKPDFEEIVYDPFENKVYLSIEGNGKKFKDEVGIYEVKFLNDDPFENEIVSIKKVDFPDWNKLIQYCDQNIGFEGLAISENMMFLGLEGFTFGETFLDSTLIYIVDKKSKKLIKTISTKNLGIFTVCGLFAYDDRNIIGVDRNRANLFKIEFDEDYNVIKYQLIPLYLPIPNHPELTYTSAIESITCDLEKNIFVIDDPWKKFYLPSDDILRKISEEDVQNFKEYIPILFKFNLN